MAVTSITVNPDPIQKGRTALFTINLDADAPNARDIGNLRVSTVFSGNSPGTLTRVNNRQWTFTLDITSNELRVRVWVNNVLFIDRFGGGLVDPPPAPTPTITYNVREGFAGQVVIASIAFSQAIASTLTAAQVDISVGTKGRFSGTGQNYQLQITLPSRTDGTLTTSIAAGVVQNSDGEDNLAGSADLSFSRPSPTITFRESSGISGINTIADVAFNAPVDNFNDFADFQVSGGSFVAFTVSEANRRFAITLRPNSQTDGTLTLSVRENRASHGNQSGSASLSFSRQGLSLSFNDARLIPGKAVQITLTSNAPILGLTASEIQVTGGSRGSLNISGSTGTLSVTPTARQDGTLAVSIPANALTHGNREVRVSQAYQRPRPTITLSEAEVANSQEVIATISWDFAPDQNDFTAADVGISAGTKGAFAGSGTEFTLRITSPASGRGTVRVAIAENVIAEGNPAASASFAYVSLPIPSFSFSTQTPKSGRAFTATIDFSLDVSGLTAAGVTVTGGTKGALTRINARRYQILLTPTPLVDGTLSIAIAADAVSEGNLAADASINYQRPAFSIDFRVTELHLGQSMTVDIRCDVATADFTTDDASVMGATKGRFTRISGQVYTLQVTANNSGIGQIAVSVAADAIPEGNLAVSETINTVRNPITITSSHASRYTSQAVTLTYTFVHPAANFTVDDITASAGTLSGFRRVSDTQYTQLLTLPSVGSGQARVSIAENISTPENAAASINVGYTAIPVTITPERLVLVHGGTASVTITFPIPITGLLLSEVLVLPTGTGVTLSNFQGSGRTYTFDVTAPNSGTRQFAIRLPADQTDQGNIAAEVMLSFEPPEVFGFLTTFSKLFFVREVPFSITSMYKAHSSRSVVDVDVDSRWEGSTFRTTQTGQVVDIVIMGTPPRTLGDDFFFVRVTLDDGTVEEQDIEYSVVNPTPILDIQPEMTFYRDVQVNALVPIRNNSAGVADGKLLGLFHDSAEDGIKISAMPDKPETNEMIDISVAHPIPGNPRITGQQPYRVVDGTPPPMSAVSYSGLPFTWDVVPLATSYAYRIGATGDWDDVGNVLTYPSEGFTSQQIQDMYWRVNSPWIGDPVQVNIELKTIYVGGIGIFGKLFSINSGDGSITWTTDNTPRTHYMIRDSDDNIVRGFSKYNADTGARLHLLDTSGLSASSGLASINGMLIDADDNVYLQYTKSSPIDHVALAKWDDSGNRTWDFDPTFHRAEDRNPTYPQPITNSARFDPSGNICLLAKGYFEAGSPNNYLLKINTDGNLVFRNSLSLSLLSDGQYALEFDSDSNIYISSQSPNTEIRKYSPSGTLLWTYDVGGFVEANIFKVDPLGNSYYFNKTNAILSKISSSGTLLWTFDMSIFNATYDNFTMLLLSDDGVFIHDYTRGYAYKISSDGNLIFRYNDFALAQFVPYRDGSSYIFRGIAATGRTGTIHKLSRDGVLEWEYDLPVGTFGSPRLNVAGEFHVIGRVGGTLYKVSTGGELLWSRVLPSNESFTEPLV